MRLSWLPSGWNSCASWCPRRFVLPFIVNPANASITEGTLQAVEIAARTTGMRIQVFNANTSREIDAAFESLVHERPDVLFVSSGPFFSTRRLQLSQWATRHALPADFAGREYAEAGGLISYGASLFDAYRQAGVYTGRILKGAKPADLPVLQSTKLELVVNLQTARILGIQVPPSLLLHRRRGDRVRRREFISLLGGVAAPGRSQQRAAAGDAGDWLSVRCLQAGPSANLAAAFRKGLRETGYIEGQNVS